MKAQQIGVNKCHDSVPLKIYKNNNNTKIVFWTILKNTSVEQTDNHCTNKFYSIVAVRIPNTA